jgi:hypothetical protein
MSKWVRWQDWAVLVTGVYAFLSPIWTSMTSRTTETLVVLEVVTVLVAFGALVAPDVIALPRDATCACARASLYRRRHTTAGEDRGVRWI